MRVAIFGTGYVGLVTGTCLADVGHEVVCVDVDAAKVEALADGVVPIYEPGLEPMVKANHAAGRLRFTTDAAAAVAHGEILVIAVGTPPDEDGSADLRYVLAVARTMKLNRKQTVDALGIAGSMTGGIIEYLAEGAWTKRLHPGWAAHAAIQAARKQEAPVRREGIRVKTNGDSILVNIEVIPFVAATQEPAPLHS